MAFFDQIKEKITAALFFICSKVRRCVDVIKISGKIHSIEGEIRRFYEDLGRTIYQSKGQDMDACREICDKIDECTELLEELTARDMQLRVRVRCPQCGAVMNKKARFCSACGAAMPEIPAGEDAKKAAETEEKPESAEE